jgi:hypothetical protein
MTAPILSVVEPPAPVLDLVDVKLHLRVDTDDDDTLIAGLIDTVTADIDGPHGWLRRAIGQQTILLTAAHFPGGWCGRGLAFDWSFGRTWGPDRSPLEIHLPCPPVQSVTSIVYLDASGATQTVDPTTYALVDRVVFPLGGASWPATAVFRPDAVKITYVAGFADGALPPAIRSGLLLKLGTLYANRNDGAAVTNGAADALLSRWRVFG